MLKVGIVLLCASLIGAVVSPNALYENNRVTVSYRSEVPRTTDWVLQGVAQPNEGVSFSIALKQRNMNILETAFWDISNPKSSNFGKQWTKEQVMDLISPPEQVVNEFLLWFQYAANKAGSNATYTVKNTRDALMVHGSVRFAEELFKTELFQFHSSSLSKTVIKHWHGISAPASLANEIQVVTGITEFHPTTKQNYKEKAIKVQAVYPDNQCNVPYTLKNLYGVPQNLTVTNPNANSSIFSQATSWGEGFGYDTILYWEKINGLKLNPINCTLGDGANFSTPNDTDDEGQLDTQMMTGMAPDAKICFWIIDGWMLDFAMNLFNTPSTPWVVSMSYGWNEDWQCDTNDTSVDFVGNCSLWNIPNSMVYIERTNYEFMKLGIVGHTLLASSGDQGVDGGNGYSNCSQQTPNFPASSPYILSVGATSVEPSNNTDAELPSDAPPICTNPEFQCNCSTSVNEQPALSTNTAEFDSGGGFSGYTPMPKYQVKAVKAYLASGVALPPLEFGWNQSNRAYPDVAAVGENICNMQGSGTICSFLAGTSASCPLWASLITLLNNDRLNAGKKPLGFVNQIIYDMFDTSSSKYFNNNWGAGSSSNNNGCGENFGFVAQAGFWSPVAGCGSPKFAAIREYISTLQ